MSSSNINIIAGADLRDYKDVIYATTITLSSRSTRTLRNFVLGGDNIVAELRSIDGIVFQASPMDLIVCDRFCRMNPRAFTSSNIGLIKIMKGWSVDIQFPEHLESNCPFCAVLAQEVDRNSISDSDVTFVQRALDRGMRITIGPPERDSSEPIDTDDDYGTPENYTH